MGYFGQCYFIIDELEMFEFANSVVNNGDVHGTILQFCKEELSLFFCGAVLGSDTWNGSRFQKWKPGNTSQ